MAIPAGWSGAICYRLIKSIVNLKPNNNMNKAKGKFGETIKVGDIVLWHDPDEEHRDLNIWWHVYGISSNDDDAVVQISSGNSEAEVFPCELELFDFAKWKKEADEAWQEHLQHLLKSGYLPM